VAGFLFGSLGHVPRTGEAVTYDAWRFEVDLVDGRRIRRIRVEPLPASVDDAGPGSREADRSGPPAQAG
jgi:CBS domain containing-hemolysin-like protein